MPGTENKSIKHLLIYDYLWLSRVFYIEIFEVIILSTCYIVWEWGSEGLYDLATVTQPMNFRSRTWFK